MARVSRPKSEKWPKLDVCSLVVSSAETSMSPDLKSISVVAKKRSAAMYCSIYTCAQCEILYESR